MVIRLMIMVMLRVMVVILGMWFTLFRCAIVKVMNLSLIVISVRIIVRNVSSCLFCEVMLTVVVLVLISLLSIVVAMFRLFEWGEWVGVLVVIVFFRCRLS